MAASFVTLILVTSSSMFSLEGRSLAPSGSPTAAFKSDSMKAHNSSAGVFPFLYSSGASRWSTLGTFPQRVTSSKYEKARKNLASAMALRFTSLSGATFFYYQVGIIYDIV